MEKINPDGSSRFLMLDYDTLDASQLLARLPFVTRKLDLHVLNVSYSLSSSGRGIHAVVLFRETLPPAFICAIQIMCGSDWRRETFNLVRVRSLRRASVFWRQRWNTLYSEKMGKPE